MEWFDAHNHLQDERLDLCRDEVVRLARDAGVRAMVVNGSCESDWQPVADLAARYPGFVIPAFGYHPWYVRERTAQWQSRLTQLLETIPGAVIGEIGIDRWILNQSTDRLQKFAPGIVGAPPEMAEQEDVFLWQLQLASHYQLPASIHCLDAFGRLHELLNEQTRLHRGFLLHSYGGSREMVPIFVQLGAYFSFPGYFAHDRKSRRREAFLDVPLDRLLIETDAPDQVPPPSLSPFSAIDRTGTIWNHPANLPAIGQYLAKIRGLPELALSESLKENFERLFLKDGTSNCRAPLSLVHG